MKLLNNLCSNKSQKYYPFQVGNKPNTYIAACYNNTAHMGILECNRCQILHAADQAHPLTELLQSSSILVQ